MSRSGCAVPEIAVAGALASAAAALARGAERHVRGRMPAMDLDSPGEEARALLASLLDVRRSWPTHHADDVLAPEVVDALLRAADRRARGAPIQYATGRAAFRHLTLAVDERVLIPRPETEVLVDLALERCEGGTVVDVGTGSGCIALSLASEGRFERVIATDVSADALGVARANAERVRGVLRAPVEFRVGSLLAPVAGERVRMIVSNPPYIASAEASALPALVRDWEPAIALYSPNAGMAHITALAREGAAVLEAGGWLLLEVDARRAGLAAETVRACGWYEEVAVHRDLTGRDRFVTARRRAEAAADAVPNVQAPEGAQPGAR
jgi:release factor glutamine methyltransferase